jgi:hypothetical protein
MHVGHGMRVGERWAVVERSVQSGAFGGDLLLLPNGTLLCSYGRLDFERELHQQVVISSDDRGRSWSLPTIVDEQPGLLKTTRGTYLTRLSDTRIAMLSDGVEDGFVIRWSHDDGATWSAPQFGAASGTSFYNNHIVETADGGMLLTTRGPKGGTPARKCAMLYRSDDQGTTWDGPRVILEDPELNLTEPSMIRLRDGRLMCLVRENSYNFRPTYKSFSEDDGLTWSPLQAMSTYGQEVYLEQLGDGPIMIVYRHAGGYAATRAWIGDADESVGYESPGTVRRDPSPTIEGDALVIRTSGKGHTALYHLPPPESDASTVCIEAELRCVANNANACGIHVAQAGWVAFHPDRVELPDCDGLSVELDTTKYRRYRIVRSQNDLVVFADEREILRTGRLDRGKVLEGVGGRIRLGDVNAFGTQSPFFARLDCEAHGEAHWRWVKVAVDNPCHEDDLYEWSASSGRTPDWYERERTVDVEDNYGGSPYFVGQAAFVEFPDGEIVIVNGRQYERADGRRSSGLKACSLDRADFAD